jgi:hypothetical protein
MHLDLMNSIAEGSQSLSREKERAQTVETWNIIPLSTINRGQKAPEIFQMIKEGWDCGVVIEFEK